MPCECEAIISEKDERAKLWMKIFGKLSFPLRHPVLMDMGNVVGLGYEGDANKLTGEQRQILIREMMKKFHISRKDVEIALMDGVIPIKAENVTLKICELHLRGLV